MGVIAYLLYLSSRLTQIISNVSEAFDCFVLQKFFFFSIEIKVLM